MPKELYRDRQGWFPGMPRFYIEQRVGCIAVVDSSLRDFDEPGLNPDSNGVVWFKMGEQISKVCELCGHHKGSEWIISEQLILDAVLEADKRNYEDCFQKA